jgi:hypothetical protein
MPDPMKRETETEMPKLEKDDKLECCEFQVALAQRGLSQTD